MDGVIHLNKCLTRSRWSCFSFLQPPCLTLGRVSEVPPRPTSPTITKALHANHHWLNNVKELVAHLVHELKYPTVVVPPTLCYGS